MKKSLLGIKGGGGGVVAGQIQMSGTTTSKPKISTDFGFTWNLVAPNDLPDGLWRGVHCSADGQYMAMTIGTDVWVSNDYGSTATLKYTNTNWNFGDAYVSSDGQYMVAYTSFTSDGVARSTDYGETWTIEYSGTSNVSNGCSATCQYGMHAANNSALRISNNYCDSFSISTFPYIQWKNSWISKTGQYILATANQGTWLSTDFGATNSQLNITTQSTLQHRGCFVSTDGQTIIVAESNNNVHRSLDGGATWTQMTIPTVEYGIANIILTADDDTANIITVGEYNKGYLITTDAGVSWTRVDEPDTPSSQIMYNRIV